MSSICLSGNTTSGDDMKRFAFVLLVLMLSNDSSKAETSKYFIGAGALSCREYIANESSHDTVYTWIQGYMTGMNIVLKMIKTDTVDLWSMSTDEQEAFIKSFCIKNGSSFLAQAGDALFDRLMKIQK